MRTPTWVARNGWCAVSSFLGLACSATAASSSTSAASSTGSESEDGHGGHVDQAVVLFYMIVAIACGMATFKLISYLGFGPPFTVAVFLEGMILGLIKYQGDVDLGPFGQSMDAWVGIDPHLLLYVFLPVLLFGDAMKLNFEIIKGCALQCLLLAGPGVLFGSGCSALVAQYILPYDWDFKTSLCFGSILAATDPVAVVGLLNELGCSKVLTMQIAGESLLNDGVAIVVWTVAFNMMSGTEYSAAGLLEVFSQLALGGTLLGLLFGGLTVFVICRCSDPFNHGDSLLQGIATVLCAYAAFFFTEHEFKCSGVLGTVFAAVVLARLMWPHIVHEAAVESFWHMVEFMANTLIFFLAGTVIAQIFSEVHMSEIVWLLILYAFAIVIRFAMVVLFYPILKVVGFGTNWKDCTVIVWGGLRGAVGLALALAVKASTKEKMGSLFVFHVGGIALLTLVINATSCKALVEKLGMTRRTWAKEDMLQHLKEKQCQLVYDKYRSIRLEHSRYQNLHVHVLHQWVTSLGVHHRKTVTGRASQAPKMHADKEEDEDKHGGKKDRDRKAALALAVGMEANKVNLNENESPSLETARCGAVAWQKTNGGTQEEDHAPTNSNSNADVGCKKKVVTVSISDEVSDDDPIDCKAGNRVRIGSDDSEACAKCEPSGVGPLTSTRLEVDDEMKLYRSLQSKIDEAGADDHSDEALCTEREFFYSAVRQELRRMMCTGLLPRSSRASSLLNAAVDYGEAHSEMKICDWDVIMHSISAGSQDSNRLLAKIKAAWRDLRDGTLVGENIVPVRRRNVVFDCLEIVAFLDAHEGARQKMEKLMDGSPVQMHKATVRVLIESKDQEIMAKEFAELNHISEDVLTHCRTLQLAMYLCFEMKRTVHDWVQMGAISPGDSHELLDQVHADYGRVLQARKDLRGVADWAETNENEVLQFPTPTRSNASLLDMNREASDDCKVQAQGSLAVTIQMSRRVASGNARMKRYAIAGRVVVRSRGSILAPIQSMNSTDENPDTTAGPEPENEPEKEPDKFESQDGDQGDPDEGVPSEPKNEKKEKKAKKEKKHRKERRASATE